MRVLMSLVMLSGCAIPGLGVIPSQSGAGDSPQGNCQDGYVVNFTHDGSLECVLAPEWPPAEVTETEPNPAADGAYELTWTVPALAFQPFFSVSTHAVVQHEPDARIILSTAHDEVTEWRLLWTDPGTALIVRDDGLTEFAQMRLDAQSGQISIALRTLLPYYEPAGQSQTYTAQGVP